MLIDSKYSVAINKDALYTYLRVKQVENSGQSDEQVVKAITTEHGFFSERIKVDPKKAYDLLELAEFAYEMGVRIKDIKKLKTTRKKVKWSDMELAFLSKNIGEATLKEYIILHRLNFKQYRSDTAIRRAYEKAKGKVFLSPKKRRMPSIIAELDKDIYSMRMRGMSRHQIIDEINNNINEIGKRVGIENPLQIDEVFYKHSLKRIRDHQANFAKTDNERHYSPDYAIGIWNALLYELWQMFEKAKKGELTYKETSKKYMSLDKDQSRALSEAIANLDDPNSITDIKKAFSKKLMKQDKVKGISPLSVFPLIIQVRKRIDELNGIVIPKGGASIKLTKETREASQGQIPKGDYKYIGIDEQGYRVHELVETIELKVD